jgi:hypothetical protein
MRNFFALGRTNINLILQKLFVRQHDSKSFSAFREVVKYVVLLSLIVFIIIDAIQAIESLSVSGLSR